MGDGLTTHPTAPMTFSTRERPRHFLRGSKIHAEILLARTNFSQAESFSGHLKHETFIPLSAPSAQRKALTGESVGTLPIRHPRHGVLMIVTESL
jgi:hypothetical protein